MFTSKNKPGEVSQNNTTIIGAGTVITGNIEASGDIRIDGTLVGNLYSKDKVIIGQEGTVEGDITGQQADIMGKVTGMLRVRELLQLKGRCVVSGEIHTGRLEVEPSATFNGTCHMGANVVEINADNAIAAAN